jgi:hypothetical protein
MSALMSRQKSICVNEALDPTLGYISIIPMWAQFSLILIGLCLILSRSFIKDF